MELKTVIKETWLTQKARYDGLNPTLAMVALLLLGSLFYLYDFFNASQWMGASFDTVFKQKEYWRLWTALFAHGDLAHVLANLVLLIPFGYFLSAYFGLVFFPLLAFFIGGFINAVAVHYMPPETFLIGASGVVHWMGAAWITLYLLIDRADTKTKRTLKAFGVSIILFIPSTFKPDVSYLSHFLGYCFGVASALGFAAFHWKKFKSAEVISYSWDDWIDLEVDSTGS